MIRPYVVGADRKARGGGGERVGGGKGGGDWVVSWQSGSEFFFWLEGLRFMTQMTQR